MKNDEWLHCELNYHSPLSAMRANAYCKYAAAVLVIELIIAFAGVCSPLAQRFLIDGINALNRQQTIAGALAVAVLLGINIASQTGSYLLRFRLGVEARCRLKSAVYHCMLGLPESFLMERGSGYFFNRIQADSAEIVSYYSGDALLQFSAVLKFLFAFSVIMCLHWECACLTFPFLLMQFFFYQKYKKQQYRIGHRIQECVAVERSRMQEYLSGYTTLKTHNAIQHTADKLDQGFIRWRILAFQRLFLENRFRILSNVPVYLCCGGVAVYGLQQIFQLKWTLGELWALLMLFRQIFSPVQRLAEIQFKAQTIQAAWDRLHQICNAANPARNTAETSNFSMCGDIVFTHIGFSYAAEQDLFHDLNFTVKANQLLFLTGANGTGKSTIFQLLLRLYEPLSGEIQINGRDIRFYPLMAYRSRIGYLGQTPDFFPGTIRENLLLDSCRRDEEIMAVFDLLKSSELIRKRTDGLNSIVAERGLNFSGGERLRLALARELLRDKDILLLDEPGSNLDFETRKEFYDLLIRLQGKYTIIAIIHDQLPLSDHYSLLNLSQINR